MADLESDTVTFFDLDESGVEMVFNLNFIGTLLPTQAFARQMVGRAGCNILEHFQHECLPAFDKNSGVLRLQSRCYQLHAMAGSAFQQVGIRVNAIAPGSLPASRTQKLLYNEDGKPTARTGKILAATPMGRFGNSEKDLVGALLFLLNNDAAGFITGICLPVDGGFSAYSGV